MRVKKKHRRAVPRQLVMFQDEEVRVIDKEFEVFPVVTVAGIGLRGHATVSFTLKFGDETLYGVKQVSVALTGDRKRVRFK